MNAAGAILLEVMDKEISIPQMWVGYLLFGALAVYLAPRSIAWPVAIALWLAVVGWGQALELNDLWVGPAIRREAGEVYVTHSYASLIVGLLLCVAGIARHIRRRLVTRASAANA
ncbi:hypothetical protein [Longimicrobium sp.]|jgi:hypothetical protein|uniref:hypothetical protein n=1 Tax=Longimicrobium sp. TaxID=2029185 RepID=UPI002ED8586A